MTSGTERPEHDHDVYRTLVESTKAIPWTIDWATMRFTYIGPQIETLLGWTPESWVTVQDWVERMHPDDRERVVGFCVAQSQAGTDHEADYRAMTRDGDYVWIRDVVHVVRGEDGAVRSLVGFMFDIRDRKRSEEQLAQLQAGWKSCPTRMASRAWPTAACSTRCLSASGTKRGAPASPCR